MLDYMSRIVLVGGGGLAGGAAAFYTGGPLAVKEGIYAGVAAGATIQAFVLPTKAEKEGWGTAKKSAECEAIKERVVNLIISYGIIGFSYISLSYLIELNSRKINLFNSNCGTAFKNMPCFFDASASAFLSLAAIATTTAFAIGFCYSLTQMNPPEPKKEWSIF